MGRADGRRSASRGRAGRGAGAARGRRPATPATAPKRSSSQARRPGSRAPLRVSWSRRLGIAVALLVVGASVVLAGQALGPAAPPDGPAGSGQPTDGASPTPAPLPQAPLLVLPAQTLTTVPLISLSGRLVEELPRDGSYRLRLYVNGERVRDRRLPRRDEFTLDDVALIEGMNTITLAVNGPAGESLHSAPVQIELDSTAPQIALLEPTTGQVVYEAAVTVRGTSEPGATLSVTNATTSGVGQVEIGADGTFELSVNLLEGFNELRLEALDAAGNRASALLTVARRSGAPSVRLELSRTALNAAALPTTIWLEATVRDASGAPIDGAEVFFSLSPPGTPTITLSATTVGGVARWPSVRISTAAVPGEGLATVVATLADGTTLSDSVFFTID